MASLALKNLVTTLSISDHQPILDHSLFTLTQKYRSLIYYFNYRLIKLISTLNSNISTNQTKQFHNLVKTEITQ